MSTIIDVNEAAKELKLSTQQVRYLCRTNKIKAKKLGGKWLLEQENVTEYLATHCCGVAEDRPIYKTKGKNRPNVLSFFSGAMGLDIGFEQAGFEILLACEIDNACRKTIKRNKPHIALIGDIHNYSANDIRKKAGLSISERIDVIIGGPPCQAFSTAGKRKSFEDKRGNVFLVYLDLLSKLNPNYIIIENVRGLMSASLQHRSPTEIGPDYPPLTFEEIKGSALNLILYKLESYGYKVSFNLYNSANFGAPQKRERIVMICSKKNSVPYLIPTHSENSKHGLPKWRTFREVTKSLENSKHHYIEFPEKRLKYYKLLSEGQNWRYLPTDLQKEALGKSFYSGGGKTGFLRRLAWDEPSPTLVTHPAMPATDLAHPIENRPLSIEEYKKIQEFPDDWIIEGSILEQYKQIGNAVPTSLGKAIGTLLKRVMNGEIINKYQNFPYSRYKKTSHIEWIDEFTKRTYNYPGAYYSNKSNALFLK